MTGLKVVALISGGKDSIFSILHCLANGHDVIALGNLYPPLHRDHEAVEDMDSLMYQTIGHAILPLFEQALGLPLYRQEIVGSAVNQHKSYGRVSSAAGAEQDETEALVPLLMKVVEAHPEVNAVSTGAILSDYQRTRVESVALRLGLTPLSYLWQWPSLPPHTQASLLEDMAAVGQDSRLIKVASGGLDDSFLWQNVADRRSVARLTKAAERFGSVGDGAVLGEGGEYETLAVNGPAPLWKQQIIIDDKHRAVIQGEAGSAYLRLASPELAPQSTSQGNIEQLRRPPLLDEHMANILQDLLQNMTAEAAISNRPLTSSPLLGPDETHDPVADRHAFPLFGRTGSGADASAQMRTLMDALNSDLSQQHMHPRIPDIAYTSIILRDMADFAAVNKVYGSYFPEPLPPARVTLACADVLPEGCAVMLGATVPTSDGLTTRSGLHVQSQSYWAPANIGPYSQAIAVPAVESADDGTDIVYVAGQIPLEPTTMELTYGEADEASQPFAHQTVLALQHMMRVGACMKANSWLAAIVFVVCPKPENVPSFARIALDAWRALHAAPPDSALLPDEDEDFDIWDATHRHGHAPLRGQRQSAATTIREGGVPPLWVVSVDALPRRASVEWVGYGTTKAGRQHTGIPHLQYLLDTFRQRVL